MIGRIDNEKSKAKERLETPDGRLKKQGIENSGKEKNRNEEERNNDRNNRQMQTVEKRRKENHKQESQGSRRMEIKG